MAIGSPTPLLRLGLDPDVRYTGWTPIATCHFLAFANLLARHGVSGSYEQLGMAWGSRWAEGSVLYGSGAWASVVSVVANCQASIETYPSALAARQAEMHLSMTVAGCIVEVDEYFLPHLPGEPMAHVVHTVNVYRHDGKSVVFVDVARNAERYEVPVTTYDLMRSNPCEGREEPFKLYALRRAPQTWPTPSAISKALVEHQRANGQGYLACLRDYLDWCTESSSPLNVCRVAGERYQSQMLLRWLAAQGDRHAAALAPILSELSERWYLLHLLSTQADASSTRSRGRALSLLSLIIDRERALQELIES